MTKEREALKLALEALDKHDYEMADHILWKALAQPEQEPVACVGTNGELMWLNKSKVIYSKPIPLYTTPPQRKPLTDEEIAKIASTPCAVVGSYVHTFARAIEAAHGIKEKNT